MPGLRKTTTVIDKGWKRIQRDLKKANGAYTKIGVQTGTIHQGEDGPKSMASIYAANEFGTDNIPARPTLRPVRDETRAIVNRMIAAEKSKILKGESTPRRSLGLIGLYVEQQVKKKIRSNVNPPNAPSTVRRKQKNKPGPVKTLIDTGQLVQSIRHVEVMR